MQLYKGYVLTKNKQCIEKIKGRRNFKTLDEVKNEPEYAGIIGNDTILVDIDEKYQSEILMNIVEDMQLDCKVIQTTRGRHFLFKNSDVNKNGTHLKLACGLEADIKIGNNQYEVLKYNGVERFVEWDVEEGVDYQELPKFLIPIKSNVDFLNMSEGEGRNNELFKYILALNKAGFTKTETRDCINIINKYVLKEPLTEEEIETITRDDAFPATTFFDGSKFLHNNFATFIKNNNHIKRINGQLHVYDNGIYIEGSRQIEAAMIKHLPILTAKQRTEVIKYLDIICPVSENIAPANYIAFNNGIYDMASDKLIPFSPDFIITNKIPHNYNSSAYSELLDKTLNKIACNDNQIRLLLEECIGYLFYRRNELSKSFILTGKGANGKSTFLDLIKDILGNKNYSALDLNQLDERFSVATMGGMLANIGDDISDDFLQGSAVANFKKVVSGNQVKAEIKGDPNILFLKLFVKLIFSANDIPKMKDKTGAVLRRLVIIPFNATFNVDDPDFDPFITYKLKSEDVMEYAINLGIEGLKRVLKNNDFTKSDKVQKELSDYEVSNNPIILFLQDKELCEIENQPTKEVYRAYRMFCVENGFNEMTLANFSKEINKRLNLTTIRKRINGKLMYVFTNF